MKPGDISYISDLCKPYSDSLKGARSIEEMRDHLAKWELLAPDAVDVFNSPWFSWDDFAKGRKKENRGVFAGEDWVEKYGAILLPELLVKIGIMAQEYLVPDGYVFIRCRQQGVIVVEGNRAHWQDRKDGAR